MLISSQGLFKAYLKEWVRPPTLTACKWRWKWSWPNNDYICHLIAAFTKTFFQRYNTRLTTWIEHAWKWEQESSLSFHFNIICSTFTKMKDCNIMHSLSSSWLFMQKCSRLPWIGDIFLFFFFNFLLSRYQSIRGWLSSSVLW